ncbi:MAG TPA: c-type cytochrome, partial [Longimicrobiales bacterium]|nr:c-type cytochrome [Longimicrobiales bacterium]
MTRKDRSKVLVAVTGILVFAAAGVFAGVHRAPARPEVEADAGAAPAADTLPEGEDRAGVARGRALFRDVGCTGCHSAEGEGSRRL